MHGRNYLMTREYLRFKYNCFVMFEQPNTKSRALKRTLIYPVFKVYTVMNVFPVLGCEQSLQGSVR